MASFGALKCLLKNLMSSVFAFPFSGGAAIRIFKVPSAMASTNSDFGDFGITLILRYCGSICGFLQE